MKRFQFQLQSVLDFKQRTLDDLMVQLDQAQSRMMAQEYKRDQARENLASYDAAFAEKRAEGFTNVEALEYEAGQRVLEQRLRHEQALLDQRQGLMLGICNGFQALIKLGLVPYGRILDMDETMPTLTFNTIARHQSKIVRTRVASNKSPWLALADMDEIYNVAISHGEGRFLASEELVAKLAANGQICTQYVDMAGNATGEIQFNPNDSVYAIEGITSPDGRVLGKMGHNERYYPGLYRNVPGNYDMHIFEAAVKYFR